MQAGGPEPFERRNPLDPCYERHLRAAQAGDLGSVGWLLSKEWPWLLRRCGTLVFADLPGLQPEDLAQESSLRFGQLHTTLHFTSQAALRRWLWTVARNRWVTLLRRKESFPHEGLIARDNAGFAPRSSPRHWMLWDLRRRLPPRQDLAIMLRDYCGCDFGVIADILGCSSTDAAQSLRLRGLHGLLSHVPSWDPPWDRSL